ncbi:hypothetical protein DsansV1_C25g0186171 [Dioscorea sansibarensis]
MTNTYIHTFCSVCGTTGHNKRYHKGGQVNTRETSAQHHQAPDEATENNPMDAIDSQVLQEHFEMVHTLIGGNQQEANTSQTQSPENPVSQLVNAPY